MNPNPTPTPTAEQRPTPEENPLASFDRLVRAIDGKPTGKFQLQVGELIVYSDEWNAAKAEKWMPLIVSAVNSHAALERRNAELAEALDWCLAKEPSPCRCVSFATPPHVCIAHAALAGAKEAK